MSSIYRHSEWINSPQQDRLFETYFNNSPIKVDMDFHGSQTVKDNQLVLGPWAGPKSCITNLIHEMAHLVEIDDARILKPGWGLTTPTEYIPGRYSHLASVPVTWQPIKRELRVIAMQWQLENHLGIPTTPAQAVSAMQYMPDWCNVPTPYEGSYKERDELRLGTVEFEMLEYTKKYTLEYFNQEWKRKVELLRSIH